MVFTSRYAEYSRRASSSSPSVFERSLVRRSTFRGVEKPELERERGGEGEEGDESVANPISRFSITRNYFEILSRV